MKHAFTNLNTKTLQIATIVLLGGLFGLSIFSWLYRGNQMSSELIAQDVKKLAELFKTINADVKITGFDSQKNHINFLSVAAFKGAQVGPMLMLHPEKWKGPYVKDDLTIQGKEYMVVNTSRGYYIVPGDGIVLANGKKVGKDIVFDATTNIDAMLQNPQQLQYNGEPLAAPFPLTPAQEIIKMQIDQLYDVLMKIHTDCSIISFDYQQNGINFLTIEKVAGSEVGSLNMTYPQKWQGPYVKEEIKYQTKNYMVVKTSAGYYITPGNDVVLPNGKIIGKDIVLNEQADVEALLKDEGGLVYKGVPLARKLDISKFGIAQLLEQNLINPEESILE